MVVPHLATTTFNSPVHRRRSLATHPFTELIQHRFRFFFTEPIEVLRQTPRRTGGIVTIIFIHALSASIGPVIEKSCRIFRRVRFKQSIICIHRRCIPEIGIILIHLGKQPVISRRNIGRIFLVVPSVTRFMQTIFFKFILFHIFQKRAGFI